MRNFDESPFLVIWEVTQACDLACVHCRANALPMRNESELTTGQGFELLEAVKSFGSPLMVFTGGDPLKRPDLFPLLEKSCQLGLRTTLTPSATPLLTEETIARFHSTGIARMAVSLDGADAASHDGFRRVNGSFARTIQALDTARRIGLETQINTTVTRLNRDSLDRIAAIVAQSGAKLWSVFFLIPTGRATSEHDISAEEYEVIFRYLFELSERVPFDIKTTEAQHYRRYVAQHRKTAGQAALRPMPNIIGRQSGINDGKGFVFISHSGEIYPSGFLPLSAGNVRRHSLVDIYRHSPLFRSLRDGNQLSGKCGICEYRFLCGGSRSRAFALTGDYLASDPRCLYHPSTGDIPAPNSLEKATLEAV